MCAIRWWSALLLAAFIGAGAHGWTYDEPSLREACTNAYDYGDPVCVGNSTLYWGTGNHSDLSCAHCVCDEGWSGADCGRCDDISVCPSKMTVDGEMAPATNCSANTLLLTEEEARSDAGKVFSCSCGGGEDGWTDFLCGQQPDTWIQFGVTGGGTDDDPAFVVLKEFAGIHARTEEKWPGQYQYHYPKIFDGTAGPCKVYRDKCFEIPGTDVGKRDCVIYECGDTEGLCPPEEYPMCDGFPHCMTPDGKEYTTHPCTAVPQGEKDITIGCQEEKVNGSYVCYYQQTGGFAPLSMTCSVGSCLYKGGKPVQPTGSKTKKVSWSIGVQMTILVSLGGLLVMTFVLFAVVTDPGTAGTAAAALAGGAVVAAAAASNKGGGRGGARNLLDKVLYFNRGESQQQQQQQQAEGEQWDDQDFRAPLLGGAGVGSEGGTTTVVGHPVGEGGAATGFARAENGSDGGENRGWREGTVVLPKDNQQVGGRHPSRPAVLWWNKLGYYVHGQGQRRGTEMAVLRGVSGFAGPESSPGGRSGARLPASPDNGTGEDPSVDRDRGISCGGLSSASAGSSRGLSSACTPSTITGILGPSGAGKSSLLDILAGRKRSGEGRTTGSISIAYGDRYGRGGGGGAKLESGAEAVRRVGGYVSQEDVLPGTLTCYEHLMFHARLRMAPGSSFSERAERVLWVLEELGLQRVADSRIGDELKRGLSGGERRRLSIATELVARPALLFADEPTTGLDAATALRVMTLLSGVASRGTTVLCSLHQPRPRVLNLLDKVILLSKGQVAYFGSPRDAEPFFRSIGRPFPADQPHPADAMLTLCCREDGRDLPLLFRRSARTFPFTSSSSSSSSRSPISPSSPSAGGSLLSEVVAADGDDEGRAVPEQHQQRQQRGDDGGRPPPPSPPLRSGEQDRVGIRRDGLLVSISGSLNDRTERVYSSGGTTELVEVGSGRGGGESAGRRDGGNRRAERRRHHRSASGGAAVKDDEAAAGGERAAAPFLVQVEALSRRLLLRAVRHPLLLVLHFGGSVAMALCLASVFGGRLGFNLAGAQDRFGALFFLLLYLSLLSLTSLPVWREDRRLFLSEAMGGAYGHLPYFTSVALADILLVRVLPPLAFAVVGYPLMGLNSEPDNPGCLLWFAGILILANVTVALAAMGVGALGLPLDLSNLVGGLMVLLLASFGRFLLNGTRIPLAWRWLSSVTPLGYAFEALLINEFSDADGRRPYRIEGSHCSPDLPVIEPLGPQILSTFSFSSERSTMHLDVVILLFIALGLSVTSLLIFFFATRTKPLVVDFLPPPRHMTFPHSGGARRTSPPRSITPSSLSPERNAESGHGQAPAATPIAAAAAADAASPAASSRVGSATRGHMLERRERKEQPSPERAAETAAAGAGDDMVPTTTGPRTDSWNVPRTPGTAAPTGAAVDRAGGGGEGSGGRGDAVRFSKAGGGSGISGGSRRGSRGGGRRVNARTGAGLGTAPRSPPPPLLLSWEGMRYEVAVPRRRRAWFGAGNRDTSSPPAPSTSGIDDGTVRDGAGEAGLLVLDGVSGFAGPSSRASRRASADGSAVAGLSPASPAENSLQGGRRDAPGNGDRDDDDGEGWQGTVTAIMGPSGAGKTSLLNALAGRIDTVHRGGAGGCCGGGGGLGLTGEVRLNGEAVSAAEIRNLSAYVTQEDVLPETLTCYEHLMFHARLRLPRKTAVEGRHERVMEVLQQLGLEDIRNSRIGGGLSRGISGGEKRRLSIGTELLTRPALLFLDEPTTGLDSSTALRVMQLVSSVASRGTTVVCSVHQPRPEVVRLLNKVILLSRGAVAFSGSPSDAEAHFASIGRPFLPLLTDTSASSGGGGGLVALKVNPADAILDAVGDAEARVDREGAAGVDGGVEGGGGLVVMPREVLVEQIYAAEASGPPPIPVLGFDGDGTRKSPPVFIQLSALLRRSIINVARDPYLAGLHVLLTLCVGVVVGTLFRDLGRLNECTAGVQDRLGVVFLLLLYLSLLCLTSLAAWRKQMSLFLHERASGAYGAAAHLTAAASVDALACRIVPPVLLALTIRPLTGLREGSLPGLIAGLVAFNLSLAGVLAACGAGAKSSQEALATGCLLVLFSALLSGFLVSKDDLPLAWGGLACLSPIGRGFEALVANEFSPYGAIFKLSTKIGSAPIVYTDPMTGDQILHCFGFNGHRYMEDLGVLAAVGACGLALAFVFLKRSR